MSLCFYQIITLLNCDEINSLTYFNIKIWMLEMDSYGSTTAATNCLHCHRRDLTRLLKSYSIINRMWMILRHSESLNIFYKKIYYKICNSEFYVWIMICCKLLMIHQHLNNFTLFQSITMQGSCLLHFSHREVPKILKMKKFFSAWK